jgi:uroporphyrinogen-III synthase
MHALGLRVDIVPDTYVADSVVSAIKHEVAGKNVLLVRGTLARDVIPVALEEAGAWVDIADAYKTVVPRTSVEKLQEVFRSSEPPEIVTFTSSSTVDNFMELMREAGLLQQRSSLRAASIGPITSQTLRGYGWEPWVEASLHSSTGLVEAMQHKRLKAGLAQHIARRTWILVLLWLLAATIGGFWSLHALFKAMQR